MGRSGTRGCSLPRSLGWLSGREGCPDSPICGADFLRFSRFVSARIRVSSPSASPFPAWQELTYGQLWRLRDHFAAGSKRLGKMGCFSPRIRGAIPRSEKIKKYGFALTGVSRGTEDVPARRRRRFKTLPHLGCVIVHPKDSRSLDRRLRSPRFPERRFRLIFRLRVDGFHNPLRKATLVCR